MSDASRQVEKVVKLAWLRRQRALTDAERHDIDRLMGLLIDSVEGLRSPHERRPTVDLPPPGQSRSRGVSRVANERTRPDSLHGSSGPSPAMDSARAAASRAESMAGAPSKRPPQPAVEASGPPEPTPQAGGSGSHPSLAADLSANPPPALRPHRASSSGPVAGAAIRMPTSPYTPPRLRPFVADYFGAMEVEPSSGAAVTRLVRPDGEEVQPVGDDRFLLSADVFPSEPEDTDGGPDEPQAEAPEPASISPQAIIHRLAGGSVKGSIHRFKPQEGMVEVETPRGRQSVPTPEILAVFLSSLRKPPPEQGQPATVWLANGKQLQGLARDYHPDGLGFMLIPSPRRKGVDCIWIPNRAVKQIAGQG